MNRLLSFFTGFTNRSNRQRTVRYMFPAFLSFVAILGAAVITSEEVSYVRLTTDDALVEAGERFSVDVYAFAHEPVNAVDITLQFDPSAVEVIGVDKGQSVLTIWAQDPIIGDGSVILRGGTYRKGFLGEHKIARINLTARETGQSSFTASEVVMLAGDGEGTAVTVAEDDSAEVSVYVYDENSNSDSIGVEVEVSIITDIDGDGNVSLKDVSAFMAAWSNRSKTYDFNGDGRMTFRDFSIILADLFLN